MFTQHHNSQRLISQAALLFLALMPATAGAQQSNTEGRAITIDEAVQIAIRNNKSLQAVARQVDLQQGVVEEQRAGFNPTVGSRFSITQFDEGTSANLNGQSIALSKETQKEVGLNVALPIDISGQIRAAVGQAKLEELSARLGYNVGRNNLVTQVKADYYTILRRRSYVDVAQSDLTNAQERLRVAEANFKAGVIAQFDVLRARTDAASAQEALIQARNNLSLAYAQLRRTLGVGQSELQTVEKVGFERAEVGDEEILRKEAQSNRPEQLQAQVEIRAAEQGVKLARRSISPDLSLSFGYAYLPDASGFSPRTNTWQAGVTLRVPLFDGGVARARVHQAREAVEIARTGLKNSEEQVALEAQQSYLNLLTAQERIPVAETALTQAQESYRLALVRFQTGVTATPGGSPIVEITDAQAALTRAQTDLVNAQYDQLNARAALDHALGRYSYGEKPGVANPSAIKGKVR